MKYINPKSMTFWAGLGLLLTGVATSFAEKRLDMVTISEGLAAIGLRQALNNI